MRELDSLHPHCRDQASVSAPGDGLVLNTECEGRSSQIAPSTALATSDDARHQGESMGLLVADCRPAREALSARDARNGQAETSAFVSGNLERVNEGVSSSFGVHEDVIRDEPITHITGLIRTASPTSNIPETEVANEVTEEPLVANSSVPQGESYPVLGNVVGLLRSNGTDDGQPEHIVPIERENVRKRRHNEATEQLETRSSQVQQSNEVDPLVCPICMESLTDTGDHRICSLACGHLFGKSCIKRWLQQAGRKNSKCPHCNKRAKLEDLRTLFMPRVTVIDGEGQQLAQEVQFLRAENHRLKAERAPFWSGSSGADLLGSDHLQNTKLLKEVEQKKAIAQSATLKDLANRSFKYNSLKVGSLKTVSGFALGQDLSSRQKYSGQFSQQRRELDAGNRSLAGHGQSGATAFSSMDIPCVDSSCFVLQNEVHVHGGKVFDMDADSQTLIFSNKIDGCGSRFGLSKMNFLACPEIEKIDLPSDFGAIFDIRLSPSGFGGPGKLALIASTGKKLSVMSLESNNIVLTYSLRHPPWSCAWDPCVPNLLYSGQQNGSLLVLDLRQPSSPIAVLNAPIIRPVHSLQVVPDQSMGNQQSGSREILGASNAGIFRWNLGSSVATSKTVRPQCVFSAKEKVCISLAYEGSIDTAVASFKQSPLAQSEPSSSSYAPGSSENSSQPLDGPLESRPSTAAMNHEDPSHWIFNRGQENSYLGMAERSRPHEVHWRWVAAMVGHKSQSLTRRGAIISKWQSTPGSKSLFAGGDDATNRVWLWDMESLRVTDTLVPHQCPVSDVKNVQIQGRDLMGCLSDRTFQLYQRLPIGH